MEPQELPHITHIHEYTHTCVYAHTHTHIHKRQLQLHSAPNEGAGTIEEIFILGQWEGIKI